MVRQRRQGKEGVYNGSCNRGGLGPRIGLEWNGGMGSGWRGMEKNEGLRAASCDAAAWGRGKSELQWGK